MPGRNDSDAKYLNLPFTQRHTGDAAFPTVPLGAVTVVLTGDFVLFPAGVGLGLGAGLGVGVACGVTDCAGVAPGVGVGVALGCCCAIESASNVSNSSVCAFACDVKTTALRMVKETTSHIFFIALPYISFWHIYHSGLETVRGLWVCKLLESGMTDAGAGKSIHADNWHELHGSDIPWLSVGTAACLLTDSN